MAQHDYAIANQSGAAFRSDLNNALAAIVSQNSGAVEPSVTYAYMPWADTTAGVMKLRNGANNAWITLYQLDGEWTSIALENGTAAAPSIYFKDSGTGTGLFSAGTNQVNIATGGTERVEWGASEVVFNDSGANYDLRIEGDTKPNLFFLDASAGSVSIDGDFAVTGNTNLTSLNGGPLAGTRNRIINGDMRVWQRGTSINVAGSDTYTADRWVGIAAGANYTASRSSYTVGSVTRSCLVITGATSNTLCDIAQRIESVNAFDLAGSTCTVQADVFTTDGTTVTWEARHANSADTFTSATLIATGTLTTTAGTFVNRTFSFSAPSNAANGIEIRFKFGALVAAKQGAIGNVQLEAGTVATPFERRSYGQELALCQRYYERQGEETYIGFPCPSTGGFAHTFAFPFKVQKRASPTIVYNLNNTFNVSTSKLIFQNTYAWSLQVVGVTSTNTTASTNFTVSAEL